jgi:hypothetical protein
MSILMSSSTAVMTDEIDQIPHCIDIRARIQTLNTNKFADLYIATLGR